MKLRTLHLIAALLIVASFLAAPFASAAPQQKGQPEYLQGLDALEAGKCSDAVTAFSAAVDADEERVAYWIARGVARALAQTSPPPKRTSPAPSASNPPIRRPASGSPPSPT